MHMSDCSSAIRTFHFIYNISAFLRDILGKRIINLLNIESVITVIFVKITGQSPCFENSILICSHGKTAFRIRFQRAVIHSVACFGIVQFIRVIA